MSKKPLTIEQILKDEGKRLDLKLVSGHEGLKNVIETSELNRPGLAFAGFYSVFSNDRIQILGITELSFLKSLPESERKKRLEKTFKFEIPCFIVTSGQDIFPELVDLSNKHNIPILSTSIITSRFWGLLSYYLERWFAPEITIHGGLLDVYGLGVLIIGKSGIGKSECALELVERGHRLVADDAVLIKKIAKNILVGMSEGPLKYHMEVRGLGIIDVVALFGIGSVREEKKVSMQITLEKWNEEKNYERLGIEEETVTILDVTIPSYVIPVEPGRNLSILIEVATLLQRSKSSGKNPALELNKELIRRMQNNKSEK